MTAQTAKTPATIVAITTYVIVSGIFTQSGVILGPAAAYFHTGVPDTALLFSYLNAGNLGGIMLCLVSFPALTIRQVLALAYGVFFAGIALLGGAHGLHAAFAAAVLIGFGVGTGLSTGAVIISKLFAGRRRAIAFLGTDCAFSAAGYVFPSLVGLAIAAGWPWQSGYLLVAALPVVLLVASIRIGFPELPRKAPASSALLPIATRSSSLRVLLFAAALLAYLTGQNVFTIWSPTYLQSAFHLSALQAGGIVGTFFGASSFGLITAALLVTRVAPRAVLCVSMTLAAVVTLLLAQAPDAGLFFALATAFGFCSTCMFKLMISIGSEQIASSPPQLVTFLLFCTSLGGIVAPAVSAPVVKAFGVHASLYLTWAAYAAAFALVAAALLVERIVAGHRGVPAAAAAAS